MSTHISQALLDATAEIVAAMHLYEKPAGRVVDNIARVSAALTKVDPILLPAVTKIVIGERRAPPQGKIEDTIAAVAGALVKGCTVQDNDSGVVAGFLAVAEINRQIQEGR